jgi:hypothetical protein
MRILDCDDSSDLSESDEHSEDEGLVRRRGTLPSFPSENSEPLENLTWKDYESDALKYYHNGKYDEALYLYRKAAHVSTTLPETSPTRPEVNVPSREPILLPILMWSNCVACRLQIGTVSHACAAVIEAERMLDLLIRAMEADHISQEHQQLLAKSKVRLASAFTATADSTKRNQACQLLQTAICLLQRQLPHTTFYTTGNTLRIARDLLRQQLCLEPPLSQPIHSRWIDDIDDCSALYLDSHPTSPQDPEESARRESSPAELSVGAPETVWLPRNWISRIAFQFPWLHNVTFVTRRRVLIALLFVGLACANVSRIHERSLHRDSRGHCHVWGGLDMGPCPPLLGNYLEDNAYAQFRKSTSGYAVTNSRQHRRKDDLSSDDRRTRNRERRAQSRQRRRAARKPRKNRWPSYHRSFFSGTRLMSGLLGSVLAGLILGYVAQQRFGFPVMVFPFVGADNVVRMVGTGAITW